MNDEPADATSTARQLTLTQRCGQIEEELVRCFVETWDSLDARIQPLLFELEPLLVELCSIAPCRHLERGMHQLRQVRGLRQCLERIAMDSDAVAA